MAKLFISYSRKDVWAQELGRKLRNNEISQHDVFVDYRDIHAGVNFWNVICDRIEDCDALIYVLSPDSVKSIYCLAEVRYALALNKPILPLMLRECEFPQFLNDHSINYRAVPREMSDALLLIERSLNEFGRNERRNPQMYQLPNPRPARPPQPRADETQKVEIQRMIAVAREQNESEVVNQLTAQLQAIIMALTPQSFPVASPKSSRTPLAVAGIGIVVMLIIGIIAIIGSGGGGTGNLQATASPTTDSIAQNLPVDETADVLPTAQPTATASVTLTPSNEPTIDIGNAVAVALAQEQNATATQFVLDQTATATQWTATPTTDITATFAMALAQARTATQSVVEKTANPLPEGCIRHVVQAGESPSSLAVTYGVDFLDILAVNNLTEEDASFLLIGDVLIIPLYNCPKEIFINAFLPTLTLVPTALNLQAQVEIVEVTGLGDITREQVVIRNNGDIIADISGWTLSDGQGNIFTFPADRRLFSGAGVSINTRVGDNTPVLFFWGLDLPVFEPGDVAILRNSEGEVVASVRLP